LEWEENTVRFVTLQRCYFSLEYGKNTIREDSCFELTLIGTIPLGLTYCPIF
jgi:hypothetical protein